MAQKRMRKPVQINAMEQSILAKANNKFGLNLFKIVRKDLKGHNAFLSPLSISAALSMTQIGAREKTALQMAHALGWESENGEEIHQQFQAYIAKLQQPSEEYQLSTANRIYLGSTLTVNEDFVRKTKELYFADSKQTVFNTETENEINSFVAEQTQNKIKELIAPGTLTAETKMVLVNAIYFKGRWATQFNERSTSPMPFKLAPEQTITVPTMFNKNFYGLYEDSELKFTAIQLLYKGHDISMIIILPAADFGLEELVENLTPEKLDATIKGVAGNREKIRLFLPKFKITSCYTLNNALSSLGMSDAFEDFVADFGGISDRRDFVVLDQVIHKAFVLVNEEGTEAAAATAVVGIKSRRASPPDPIVKVDHPFLFVISDKRANGSVLFLGQVDNPLV